MSTASAVTRSTKFSCARKKLGWTTGGVLFNEIGFR
jgi:hypothetical protein